MTKLNNTREILLQTAYEEIYTHGYHGTGLSTILDKAKVKKGSLYHYFKSKKELTIAIIYEIVAPTQINRYSPALEEETDILFKLSQRVKDISWFDFGKGCPLNNLVQELSNVDEDFQKALEEVYLKIEGIFEQILDKAVAKGEMKPVDTKRLAIFLVASFQGCLATAKKSQDITIYDSCISQLDVFLENLIIPKS